MESAEVDECDEVEKLINNSFSGCARWIDGWLFEVRISHKWRLEGSKEVYVGKKIEAPILFDLFWRITCLGLWARAGVKIRAVPILAPHKIRRLWGWADQATRKTTEGWSMQGLIFSKIHTVCYSCLWDLSQNNSKGSGHRFAALSTY